MEFPDEEEGEEDDDDEDDGNGDADQDGGVIWVRADGLRPGGLAELVNGGVGSDLERQKYYYYLINQTAVCCSLQYQ